MAGSVGEGCLGSGVKWRTTIPGYGVQPNLPGTEQRLI